MTTATDVVIACENVLGWNAMITPLHKARAIEAGKINKKLATEPDITLDDLMLAVEFCRRKRQPVTSPVALFWRVEDAKEMANEVVEISDLSTAVQTALAWEMLADVPDEDWIGRLTRAHGPVRAELLAEWTAAGRG